MFKRLIIGFDGTWGGRSDGPTSNVQKFCASVVPKVYVPGDVGDEIVQEVLYIPGVGSNYRTDSYLGGALGKGLDRAVLTGYRFLALNYHPGGRRERIAMTTSEDAAEAPDEIFLVGWSRGAFAARRLALMLSLPGLVRRRKLARTVDLVEDALKDHIRSGSLDQSQLRKRANLEPEDLHPEVRVKFLGVFDTVAAVGANLWNPGAHRSDMRLPGTVDVARQALALDERRLMFAPVLWFSDQVESSDVKQVWFPGGHADVGGGAEKRLVGEPAEPNAALANTSLLWMLREAKSAGLVLDLDNVGLEVVTGAGSAPHATPSVGHRLINLPLRIRETLLPTGSFEEGRREIRPRGAVAISIASSASSHAAGRLRDDLRIEDVLTLDEHDFFDGEMTVQGYKRVLQYLGSRSDVGNWRTGSEMLADVDLCLDQLRDCPDHAPRQGPVDRTCPQCAPARLDFDLWARAKTNGKSRPFKIRR